MPTYHANGLAWTYSGRFGECLDACDLTDDERAAVVNIADLIASS